MTMRISLAVALVLAQFRRFLRRKSVQSARALPGKDELQREQM